jgi:Fungal specific transcription factor domain.
MNLLSLEQPLPVLLEGLERGKLEISPQSPQSPHCDDRSPTRVTVSQSKAVTPESRTSLTSAFSPISLLGTFMEQIYIWYPVLHAEYTEEFVQAITSYLPPSTGSCLTLLILAIGCVAKCETIMDAVRRRPEATYIQAAMEMLPCVFAENSLRSAQCLLLFSIYHLCCARPCQGHEYVVMASYRLQNYLIK